MNITVNKILSMVVGIFILAAAPAAYGQSGKRLNLRNDIVYLGAFRVPQRLPSGMPTQSKLSSPLTYGGELLAFNPNRGSLYIMGSQNAEKLVYEISIPDPVNSPDLSKLNTAEFLSGGFDITDGTGWDALNADGGNAVNGGRPGGLLFLRDDPKGRMIGNSWAYYDAGVAAVNSHFVTSSKLPDRQMLSGDEKFHGYYTVGLREDSPGKANGGFVGGYMCWIPSAWQAALNGPALTGLGGVAVISRSSYGPSASVFDPADLLTYPTTSASNPIEAKMLVGYPAAHTTLGEYEQAKKLSGMDTWGWNGTGFVRGIAFPEGTRSVLFFGRMGMGNGNYGAGDKAEGTQCYGPGTVNPLEAGRGGGESCNNGAYVVGSGNYCCYDPTHTAKGNHAYPYKARIWAYDAGDLARVASNNAKPWEILPYEISDFDFPYMDETLNGLHDIGQVAYDPATQRLYVSQLKGDNLLYSRFPVIHVYEVNVDTPSLSPSQNLIKPPKNLTIHE